MVSKHAKDLENLNLYVPAKLPVKIIPNYFLPHHFASQFQPQKVIKGHLLLHISWRGLPLYRVVQQPTNVRFDHCDLSSFLYFKGDLVVGKGPRYVINPQRRQLIEVLQSNPSISLYSRLSLSIRHLSVSPLSSSLCAFLFGQCAQHTMPQVFRDNVLIWKLSVLEQRVGSFLQCRVRKRPQ